MQVIQFVPYEEELLINEINNGSVEEDESTLQRMCSFGQLITITSTTRE